jgi:glycosyltransferase involved in cell wall biosynthesis
LKNTVSFPADWRRTLEASAVHRGAAARGASPAFFSVLTVTRNRVQGLELAIRSLQAQDERDFEHVVVDGASSDGSVALLERADCPVDRWISEPDGGISEALNKAVALAGGQWIVVLHADDQLVPGALRRWRALAEAAKDAEILSCAIRFVDAEGRHAHMVRPDVAGMARRMSLPHPGMAVKRGVYERVGVFRTDFRIAMDYEFTLRALGSGARVHTDDEVAVLMRMGGLSDRELFRSRNENLRARVRWLGLRPWMLAHYTREVGRLALARLFAR